MAWEGLRSQAIYDFMKHKIKKKFIFFDNLDLSNKIKTKQNI